MRDGSGSLSFSALGGAGCNAAAVEVVHIRVVAVEVVHIRVGVAHNLEVAVEVVHIRVVAVEVGFHIRVVAVEVVHTPMVGNPQAEPRQRCERRAKALQ